MSTPNRKYSNNWNHAVSKQRNDEIINESPSKHRLHRSYSCCQDRQINYTLSL